MKTLFYIFLFLAIVACTKSKSQNAVNGEILVDSSYFKIVKVWGNHYQRGFAYGYLLGEGIIDVQKNYIKPIFGSYYNQARQILSTDNDLDVPDIYKIEAQAVIEGMNEAGTNSENYDYIDLLIGNCLVDITNFSVLSKVNFDAGCSALISWGDATAGTELDRKSVISRHVDWTLSSALTRNHLIAIHIPSEIDEQPFAMSSFAGQISCLSCFNSSGLSAMMNMLSELNTYAQRNKCYEPVWFTIRKALESKDFNGDGKNNTADLVDAISCNTSGYADGFLIEVVAPNINEQDTTIAMIAELANTNPFITFRYNNYDDNIPGDNLYVANSAIKRNNVHNYCSRYNNIVNHIGNGTLISAEQNRNLLVNYSLAPSSNIQFLQYIPQTSVLKFSFAKGNLIASNNNLFEIKLDTIFSSQPNQIKSNPAFGNDFSVTLEQDYLKIRINSNIQETINVKIISLSGIVLKNLSCNYDTDNKEIKIKISDINTGLYVVNILSRNYNIAKKVYILSPRN